MQPQFDTKLRECQRGEQPIVDGEQLRVAQVGPDSLILRDLRVIAPSTSAKLVINIDDHHEEHDVVLFEGASGTRQPVKFF